jgi:hypothetical protein
MSKQSDLLKMRLTESFDPVSLVADYNDMWDKLDTIFGPLNQAWVTYTPILAASVNPNLGAGGISEGKRLKLGSLVICYNYFKFGTGFNVGSGAYKISGPFDRDTTGPPMLGIVAYRDDSANNIFFGTSVAYTDATSARNLYRSDASVGSGGPGFAWANLDSIQETAFYQVAEASI